MLNDKFTSNFFIEKISKYLNSCSINVQTIIPEYGKIRSAIPLIISFYLQESQRVYEKSLSQNISSGLSQGPSPEVKERRCKCMQVIEANILTIFDL